MVERRCLWRHKGERDFFSLELWLHIKNENTSAPDCRILSLHFLFPECFVLMQHIFSTLSMKTDSFLQVFFLLFVSKAVCSKIRCTEWCFNRLFKGNKELCVQISLRSAVLKQVKQVYLQHNFSATFISNMHLWISKIYGVDLLNF